MSALEVVVYPQDKDREVPSQADWPEPVAEDEVEVQREAERQTCRWTLHRVRSRIPPGDPILTEEAQDMQHDIASWYSFNIIGGGFPALYTAGSNHVPSDIAHRRSYAGEGLGKCSAWTKLAGSAMCKNQVALPIRAKAFRFYQYYLRS